MTKRKIVDDAPPPPPEIIHPFHPWHKLKLVADDGVEFDCNGCREQGKGARYTCCAEEHDGDGEGGSGCCDFDLHPPCALAEDVLRDHPLFKGRAFVLLREPTPPQDPAPARPRRHARGDAGKAPATFCDACGDDVRGFVYHCFDADLDLHPSCARLPARIAVDGADFELANTKAPRRCVLCLEGKEWKARARCRSGFWSYSSGDCDGEAVSLHVACVKDEAAQESRKAREGKQMVQAATGPDLKWALQKRPKTSSSSKVKRFAKIVGFLVRVIIGVIFGDPTAMAVAVVGLVFNNG